MNEQDQKRLNELNMLGAMKDDKWENEKALAGETGVTFNCDNHGDYPEKFIMVGPKKILFNYCPLCAKEKNEAEQKEREALEKKLQLERDRKSRNGAGVSRRNEDVRFKDFIAETPEQKHVYESVHKMAKSLYDNKEVPNLIMTGKVGTGKTMLACCVVNSIFKVKRVKLIKLQDMLRKVKGSYSKDSDYSEDDAIQAYAKFDLLILDEVGVSRDTDNDKNIIFDVLDGRYQNMLPTMIISNMNIDGIKQTLGDRVVDRLRDGGGVLLGCDWESFRK